MAPTEDEEQCGICCRSVKPEEPNVTDGDFWYHNGCLSMFGPRTK